MSETAEVPAESTPSAAFRRAVAWSVAAFGVVFCLAYFMLPSSAAQNIAYVAVGGVTTVLMAVGVRLNQPRDRWSWWLLIVSNAASTIGDGIENVLYTLVLHKDVPFPSIADLAYLMAYPFMFLGVARICRSRDVEGRRENYADATIIALAALAVSWHFVMGSTVHRSDIGLFGKLVVLAYPMMDIGVLFIMVRSIVFGSSRLTVHRILAAALACTLVADSAYDVLVQHGGYSTGNIIDAGWLLNYLLMAVAALHPSSADEPTAASAGPTGRRRIPVLAFAGFVPIAVLLVDGLARRSDETPVVAGIGIVIFALVSARMSWLFQSIRAHTRRAEADAAALAKAMRDRDRLELDLRHQALHDPLTGLANRTLLYERVRESLSSGQPRRGLIGLCFCDLDGFKTINDSLGHHAGDELLTVVADRLKAIVRSTDTVARLGGDEFAILLEGVDSPHIAMNLADRIVAVMREPVQIGDRQITLSVSVGLAFAERTKSTEQLLSEADVAMYEAKARGKSRWQSFEASMRSRSIERLELANGFRAALERGEFHLVYQPQYSLTDGRLEGFESLLRWTHPTRGLVPPDRFIPLAEETGFIIPLGRWVLERSCEQAAAWADGGPAGLTMAVNISGRQLQDPSLCDDVTTALALSGLDPHRLVLEVTESSLLADCEETEVTLAGLKSIGVKVALDDFGTGYSSLSYLRRLPLDILKIDKSFVDPLVSDGHQESALVSTIVDFAHVLGLQTVAEGVEEQAQLDQLRSLGCSAVQGFLFSPPVDAEAAGRLLAARDKAAPSHLL